MVARIHQACDERDAGRVGFCGLCQQRGQQWVVFVLPLMKMLPYSVTLVSQFPM